MTQREYLLHRLQFQYKPIEWLIRSVSPERINMKPAPEKWSMHDLVTHLAKYQPFFIERLYRILNEDQPAFNRYRAEEDPEFEQWRRWSIVSLIARLVQDRQRIYEIVTGLSEEQLKRKGRHIKFGLMEVTEWLDFFLWHEAHHIFIMYQLAHDVDLKNPL